jgi:hypothetical protein
MSFKGKTNKGRYSQNKTQDHKNCISLKLQLRRKLLPNDCEYTLIEPFAGGEELFNLFYEKLRLKKRVALDIEPLKPHILKADANTYPNGKRLDFDIYDLDHHKLEVLQTFSQWAPSIDKNCTVFMTFGIMSFVRKTYVKKSTVIFNGTDEKIQLNYKDSYNMPEQYIKDVADANGFNVVNLIKIRYKHIVSYYGFKLEKK